MNNDLFGHYISYFYQSIERLCLSEGEKFVLVASNISLVESGIYRLINNLGSLVIRIIFQPIEEAANQQFCNINRIKNRLQQIKQAANYLGILLHILLLISIIIISFGKKNSSIL